ncbi:hypothetical protein ASE78_15510 [Sphingomonas sp. Leaf25]|nr:hypothetical protein ASE78_15510 [Sphingomonas sp. Leaf25]
MGPPAVIRLPAVALAALLLPGVAQARDYCSTRPSLGQSACVLDPGRVAIETALSDWERDDDSDTVLFGDSLLRIGLTDRVEAQIGWTPLGIARDRDDGRRTARSGDVTLGGRINLHHPDGSGLSYGLQPSLTIPIGRAPIGDGQWSAALIAPITYDLGKTFNVQFSPQVAVTNGEVDPGAVLGLDIALAKKLTTTAELQWQRADRSGQASAALSVAWQLSDDLFLDAGGVVGLNAAAPSLRCYSGISRRF